MNLNHFTGRQLAVATIVSAVFMGSVHAAPPPGKGGGSGGDPPPTTPTWSMSLLGTLGGADSRAYALNESGDVVGVSQLADGTWAPFVDSSDLGMLDLRDALSEQDLLDYRWETFTPLGINAAGQICGEVYQDAAAGIGPRYAIRISPPPDGDTSAIVERVDLPGSVQSTAQGINEWGDVTGAYQSTVDGDWRGFVYVEGVGAGDIGDLGGNNVSPAAINDFGQVAGNASEASGSIRAFRFTQGEPLENLGVLKVAKSVDPLANRSFGLAINDSGTVVGNSTTVKQGAVLYRAFRDSGAGMVDLGVLGGDSESYASGINNAGTVVGASRGVGFRGFVYSDDFGMLELDSSIIDLPVDAVDITVTGLQINEAGEICGTVLFCDGTRQAFILSPVVTQ